MKREQLSGPLYRLVYCSRTALPATVDAEQAIRQILASARARNAADGITSALLASATGFAQALEGTRDGLEQTFQRISSDPRHTGIALLTFTPAPRRLFSGTPVAFCGDVRAGAVDPLAGILADTARGEQRAMTGSDLLRLLVKLVRAAGDWAA